MLKLGLCCSGGLCCALLSGVLWLGGGTAVLGQGADASPEQSADSASQGCTKPGCTKNHATAGAPCGTLSGDVADVELTPDEQKVVAYLADMIENGETPMASSEQLEKELGLSLEAIEALDPTRLRAGVMGELSRRNFDLASFGGNSSKYNACSVDRNLMNASGAELERYKAEVALDGTSF